jgi:tricorn protease
VPTTGDPVSVGLLGADIEAAGGNYRIKHIYTGENWNPELRAPLSAPGVNVSEGDYILEVNGKPLNPNINFYSLFENSANRQTVLRLNDKPSRDGSRLVTVVPVASEGSLRTRAWIENNRRRVDKLSGGRLAYVWLPNTAGAGYSSFIRYFFTQQDKEGTVVDIRYNQGGMVADFIVNELDRRPMGFFTLRDGKSFYSPLAGIYGPKVMIINESAGSGGDALPYYFRLRKLGPLIGTRTWGRPGRNAGNSADDRRRRDHGSEPGVLQSSGPMGRREHRRCARHRGRRRLDSGPRSAVGARRCRGHEAAGQEPAAALAASGPDRSRFKKAG